MNSAIMSKEQYRQMIKNAAIRAGGVEALAKEWDFAPAILQTKIGGYLPPNDRERMLLALPRPRSING